MRYMTRREKYVSVVAYLTVAGVSVAVGMVYQDMPILLLCLLGAVASAGFGTGVLIAWKVEIAEPVSREDPRQKQMKVLLEDATRLRSQSEKLQRDLVEFIASTSGAEVPADAPEPGAKAAGTA